MKKLAVGVGTLLLAAVVIAVAGQRQIGGLLVDRMIESRIGVDPIAALPDGLHVKVCGSGSPLPDPGRAGPCLYVVAGDQTFVVDAGSSSARTMMGQQLPLGRLNGVFLTHFHSDHIDGLGELMLQRWAQGNNTSPLPVYGPDGVTQVVNGLNTAYNLDSGYRTAHHGADIMPPSGNGGVPISFALTEGQPTEVFNAGGLTVFATSVDHSPVKPAVAYRFNYKGQSIVISGDANPDSGLETFAAGADILFHEALSRELVSKIETAAKTANRPELSKIMFDIQDYHTSPEEAARIAEAAGAKALVLYHIVPALPVSYLKATFLGDAKDYYSGDLIIAEDGMLFSLLAK